MRRLATIIAAGSLGLAGMGMAAAGSASDAAERHGRGGGEKSAERIWLAAHNSERAAFGARPLAWNEALEAEARQWADRLAREGVLRHSRRRDTGENLWMGSAGHHEPAQMVRAFTAEKRWFSPGTFPNVSRTGNWADVGHYTQIVWQDTREVGCAQARGSRFDVFVCRYWPAGNVMGERLVPRRFSRR